MSADAVEVNHFRIRVAKAKDLPPSWYDLVLRPEKFEQHINKLKVNPYAEPTAMQLIATFLEKAGCIEGGQPLSVPPTEEKKEVLVDCALMVGSAVVQWDLDSLEKSLPVAVQFALFSELTKKYPLKGVPLPNESGEVVMAHVLYNQWLIRYIQKNMKFSTANWEQRPLTSTVDVTCSSPTHILNMVSPMVLGAMEFLKVVCAPETGLGDDMQLPKVSAKLPGSPDITWDTVFYSRARILCEILYILGTQFFFEDKFGEALIAFIKCHNLIGILTHDDHPPFINQSQLRGFLVACDGAAAMKGERRDKRVWKEEGVVDKIEKMRIGDDFEGVGQILLDDLTSREIPSVVVSAIEKEVSDWSESLAAMETQPKKPRLNQPDFSSSVELIDRVCICNGLRCVMEGKSPRCHFWKLLSEEKTHHLEYVLHVCEQLTKHKLSRSERSSLQNFIRGLCCDRKSRTGRVWEGLLDSSAVEWALAEDLEMYRHLFDPLPKLVSPVEQDESSDDTEVHKLERQVSQAVTSEEVVTAIEKLFQATPPNQHRGIVMQWMGSSSVFAPVESMPDHVTLTKYNALVHRAQHEKQAKSYRDGLELFNGALSLLTAKTTAVSAKVRQQLEDYLREQVLVVQLLSTNQEFVDGGAELIQQRVQSKELAPLLDRAKSYFASRTSLDATTLNLTGVFLLNAQEYSFLSSHNTHLFEPVKIAPRLAAAVLNVKEGQDLRKSIRDLFEAVLGVFSPPLSSGEGKVEINERQSKLRSNFDSFVENLVDGMSLSLLMAALARIWNLLKKTEDEIISEYSSHWPTAIGNPGSIDTNHVFRALSTTLSHALRLQPSMTSWLTMKGHMHCAIGDYGAAMENYLQSGAISSNFFESDVPTQTWTPVVYRRMINCCKKLGYHTHAAIFCQFLQPVDYELAFDILKTNVELTVDSLFIHFWDMTIIEYLIYIHSKKGDTHKQATAVQVAGQAELNFNNSNEVLERAAQVRKRRFLQAFYTQITNSV